MELGTQLVARAYEDNEEGICGETPSGQDGRKCADRLRHCTTHGQFPHERERLQHKPQDIGRKVQLQTPLPYQLQLDHLEGLELIDERRR